MRHIIGLLVAAVTPMSLCAASLSVDVHNGRGSAVRDAVVYAIPEGKAPAAPKRVAVMDQKDRTFLPHVLAVQTGTAVRFPNNDDIRHQVYSFSRAKTFQLPLYKGTPASPIVFDKSGVVALGCNIHDRMSAFVVIVDTPYFAKTDGSGRVSLRNLPPGRYVVHVWSEDRRNEPAPMNITVSGEEDRNVTFVTDVGRGLHGGP